MDATQEYGMRVEKSFDQKDGINYSKIRSQTISRS